MLFTLSNSQQVRAMLKVLTTFTAGHTTLHTHNRSHPHTHNWCRSCMSWPVTRMALPGTGNRDTSVGTGWPNLQGEGGAGGQVGGDRVAKPARRGRGGGAGEGHVA